MTAPAHGTFDPARGWFSANLNGWVSDPAKIGTVTEAPEVTAWDRQRFAQDGWTGKREFRPDTNLEQLIRLRDSDRPEQRDTFNKVVTASRRIELHDYETKRRAHIAAGGQIPPPAA